MNRLRVITFGAALLAGLILAVFGYLLADTQSEDRREVENRFDDVANVSAAVTDGIFQASLRGTHEQAIARFDGELDDTLLDAHLRRGNLVYALILDDRGRRLAASDGAPRRPGPAVEVALETGQARLSDLMGTGARAAVEWAIPFPADSGQRILVQAIPLQALADFLRASLGRLPTFADAEPVMIDSNGRVLGGTRLAAPAGERLDDAALLAALEEDDHGEYGDERYFAAGSISGSPFRIVMSTSKASLYESISGRTLAWVLFAAFALALLAGLFLLRRISVAAAQLQRKELNERHAVEINDNIIQGLALAKYQLEAGERDASATQVAETLREAQRLVSGLLGDAEVRAGQLRRRMAAETSRSEPSAEGERAP